MADPITEPGVQEDQLEAYRQWQLARLGKLTASRMAEATAKTKNGWAASRRSLMIELLAERLTGMPTEQYLSQAMTWGIETEPQARQRYEMKTGETVTETGFVDHPRIPNCGCSPDGLVGYDGLVEIKCPETRTHIGYVLEGKIPAQYQIQMQWQMACTGRKWCDFVSFDPRLPLSCNLRIVRLHRNETEIKSLEALAVQFLVEMSDMLLTLEGWGHIASEDMGGDHVPTKDIND